MERTLKLNTQKYNQFIGPYKYIPDCIYKIDDGTTVHVEITRKITNNILNKYKTTIPKIKEIKNFIICDETYLYKYNFKNNSLEKI